MKKVGFWLLVLTSVAVSTAAKADHYFKYIGETEKLNEMVHHNALSFKAKGAVYGLGREVSRLADCMKRGKYCEAEYTKVLKSLDEVGDALRPWEKDFPGIIRQFFRVAQAIDSL